ncbi:hypothetical protein [Streptomyces xiamenensis]|uniref:hypothetical protein n=1 Tax=Streptomyces xiamenensis TaxID=408015 RepID=UPI003D75F7DC
MREIEYQLRQRRSSLIIAWVLGGTGLLSLAVITLLLATASAPRARCGTAPAPGRTSPT